MATGLRARKKERTRETIADAAMQLFLERGFEAVTIAEIAEAAEVDAKTIYNYFPSKADLVYHRLEDFENRLLDAVRTRKPGESILAGFARFALGAQGILGDEWASERLRAIARMITASDTLLAYEEQIFARYTDSLAAVIAAETEGRPGRRRAVRRRARPRRPPPQPRRLRPPRHARRHPQHDARPPAPCTGTASRRTTRARPRRLRKLTTAGRPRAEPSGARGDDFRCGRRSEERQPDRTRKESRWARWW